MTTIPYENLLSQTLDLLIKMVDCPANQAVYMWHKRAAAFRNVVFHLWRNFRIDGSLNQSDMLKLFECLRKHFSQFLFFGKYPSFCTYLFDIQNNTIFASTRKTIIMKV